MAKERDLGRPTEEAIAKRAFEIYLQRGSVPGSEVEDWLQAEAELVAEGVTTRAPRARTPAPDVAPETREPRPENHRPASRDRATNRRLLRP